MGGSCRAAPPQNSPRMGGDTPPPIPPCIVHTTLSDLARPLLLTATAVVISQEKIQMPLTTRLSQIIIIKSN